MALREKKLGLNWLCAAYELTLLSISYPGLYLASVSIHRADFEDRRILCIETKVFPQRQIICNYDNYNTVTEI